MTIEKAYPYAIDNARYNRFDQKNNMLYRRLWDKTLPTYGKMFEANVCNHIKSGKEGYTKIDFALAAAGWTVYERFSYAFSWERNQTMDLGYGVEWLKKKVPIDDPGEITRQIKKAAKLFGSSLVGITDADQNWVYRSGFKRPYQTSEADAKKEIRGGKADQGILEQPIELPNGVNKAIVIAIEMDPEAISTAPAQPEAAAVAIIYSKMAFIIACLGDFIRNLGYRAIQCGNDTALSIPLAIDAGLGALGRHGLLITQEFGPRVRICKVFTDLPLISDKPNLNFIAKVRKTCRRCYKCAEACETQAISFSNDIGFDSVNISNNSGVRKYYVDCEKCFEFWIENSGDCGKCIAVCPFSKIKKFYSPKEFWEKD